MANPLARDLPFKVVTVTMGVILASRMGGADRAQSSTIPSILSPMQATLTVTTNAIMRIACKMNEGTLTNNVTGTEGQMPSHLDLGTETVRLQETGTEMAGTIPCHHEEIGIGQMVRIEHGGKKGR